jgi:alpha-galactosidase
MNLTYTPTQLTTSKIMIRISSTSIMKLPLFRSLFLVIIIASWLSPIHSAEAAPNKPLKVFILVGQSNMQGHAKISTLEHIGMDPKTKPWLNDLQANDGAPKVFNDVRISYLSDKGLKEGALTAGFGANETKIGPELTFGMTLDKKLDEPVLIIKAAWGGKSLYSDFRPPSAGLYKDNKEESGHYYRLTTAHVKDVLENISRVYPDYKKSQGYELCGLVWFQGWNDMVNSGVYPDRNKPGGYDEYSKLMAQFIRDIRKDLSAPKLPFVIGVMGAGGPVAEYDQGKKRYAGVHQYFRDAMAAPASLPEFKDNVTAVLTEKYWDMELTALKTRDGKINQEVKKMQKEKNLKGKEVQELRTTLRKKEFTDLDLQKLEKGISNAEFHYFGSAKILAGIGIGFAEAVLDLQPKEK